LPQADAYTCITMSPSRDVQHREPATLCQVGQAGPAERSGRRRDDEPVALHAGPDGPGDQVPQILGGHGAELTVLGVADDAEAAADAPLGIDQGHVAHRRRLDRAKGVGVHAHERLQHRAHLPVAVDEREPIPSA
jgi:hypothetical protein